MTSTPPVIFSTEQAPSYFSRLVSETDTGTDSTNKPLEKEGEVPVQQPIVAQYTHSITCPIADRDVTFWNKNGYLLLDNIFNEQLITLVRDATIPLIDNDRARAQLWHEGFINFQFPFASARTPWF